MAVSGGIVETRGPVSKATFTVSAAVTEGRLVASTAGSRRVGPAGAGSLLVQGVAMQTASAAEDQVAVAYTGTFRLRANVAVSAGNKVEAAVNGEVRPLVTVDAAGSFDPRAVVGIAEEDIAAGADGAVRLLLG